MTVRQERINRFLLEEISEIIRRMKDPRLGFVTVTGVRVSPDLRVAHVGVSVLADEQKRQSTLRTLSSASGHIRHRISKDAHLKTVPELVFHLDEGAVHSKRVAELLKQLEDEQTQQRDS